MINWLKWKLCGKELEELHRYRIKIQEYHQWLCEFPEIKITLENLQIEVKGQESLFTMYYESSKGPWTIQGLRECLRKMRKENND